MSNMKDEDTLRITVGSGEERRQLTAAADEAVTVASTTGAVVVALDVSWSMAGEKLALAKEGVIRFARDAIAQGHRVKLMPFNDKARVACEFTDEVHRIGRALGRVKADKNTNGRDAVARSRATLERRPGNRTIVLFTDGYFDDPDGAVREARRAHVAGIDVITIGTEDADPHVLAAMATRDDLAVIVPDTGIADALEEAAFLLPPTLSR